MIICSLEPLGNYLGEFPMSELKQRPRAQRETPVEADDNSESRPSAGYVLCFVSYFSWSRGSLREKGLPGRVI